MATFMQQKSNLELANEAYSELGVQFGTVKNIIGGIKEANRIIRDLKGETISNLNSHKFIKLRDKLVFMAALLEALLSVRVFGFVLHGILNIPMTNWMWIVDFVVGMFFSYWIIKGTIIALLYESNLMRVKEPKMGYFLLLIVPLINACICFQTDDKNGEVIFLVLSIATLIINAIVVRLVVKSMVDERYDEISKADGDKLASAKKSLEDLYKRFDGCRHRIEGISSKFITPYVQLSPPEKAKVQYPVDYLYVLQERIYAGRINDLVDTSKVSKAAYPFIEEFEKVENRQTIY